MSTALEFFESQDERGQQACGNLALCISIHFIAYKRRLNKASLKTGSGQPQDFFFFSVH